MKTRTSLSAWVLSVILTSSAVYGSSEDDLRRFLSEYKALTREDLLDPRIGREWADRLLNTAEDPSIAWKDRAYMFRQAAHGYNLLNDKEANRQTWEKFYEGALVNNDTTTQLAALDYFARAEGGPKNREDVERQIAYYEKSISILSDPSPGEEQRFLEKLALQYFNLGRFQMDAAQKMENLDVKVKQELLQKSVDNLQIYCDLGIFKYESEWSALYNLADACAAAGWTERAVGLYKRVAGMPDSQIDPSQAMLNAIRLEYSDKTARIGPMEAYLADAKADDSTDVFKQELGFIYLDFEMWDKAIAIFSQLCEGNKDDDIKAYDMFLMATALRRSGRTDEADEVLKTIVAKYPNSGTAQELVGRERRQIDNIRNELLKHVDSLIGDDTFHIETVAKQPEARATPSSTKTESPDSTPGGMISMAVKSDDRPSSKTVIAVGILLAVILSVGVWWAFRGSVNRQARLDLPPGAQGDE